jgi:Fe2+ transport system protein FeoA
VTLGASQPGEHIRLARVTEQVEIDLDSLTYLSSHGFIPGASATVRSKAPDGTLVLAIDDSEDTIALGPALAQHLYVAAA